jgi:hypothetical protein
LLYQIGKRAFNPWVMKRALVLTNEAARHPFRKSMPQPVIEAPTREPLTDGAFFLISFVSGLIIFFGMIV